MKPSMHAREAISGYFVVLARNCLASTLDYIVMQMKTKLTVKRAIELLFKKLCNNEKLFIYPKRVKSTARVIYNNAPLE